jgi:putative spermidine/putrescine transport system permease protein
MINSASAGARWAAGLVAVPLLLIVLLFELLPLLAVAVNGFTHDGAPSLENHREILGSAFQRNAFWRSIWLALVTSAIALAASLPLGRSLQGMSPRVQRIVMTYANLGANFTGFPVAFAFIILFGLSGSFTLLLARTGLLDGFNIYSTTGLALVYCYFQVPLGLMLVFPALGAITPDIEEAARLMGASRLSFWARIALPILLPSLVSSFVLLFANAMGTYATAFALAGGNANLVTIRIGELVAGDVFSDPNLADALATLLVVVLVLPIAIERLLARRRHRDGR